MLPNYPTPLVPHEAETLHKVFSLFFSKHTEVEDIKLLPGGYLNRNYLLRTAKAKFVLRRYDYNSDYEVILYEHRLLEYLPTLVHHAYVPKPIAIFEGKGTIVLVDGHHYALFPFIAGLPVQDVNLELVANGGTTLAVYHNAVAGYQPLTQQRQTYGKASSLHWMARHAPNGLPELWEQVAKLPIDTPHKEFIHTNLAWLANEASSLENLLTPAVYLNLPQLVIHSDFGPHNLLCEANIVSGMLDFDLVAWDARAFDLAIALIWFSWQIPPQGKAWTLNKAHSQAFFEAYAKTLVRPLSTIELSLLPVFMRSAHLWLLIWYLDVRIGGFEWYPDQAVGVLSCYQWFQEQADAYVKALN